MYTYGQSLLSGHNFRLMLLLRGTWHEQLECSLRVKRLDETLNYQALSYAWGSLNTSGSILIGGARKEITANLEKTLKHLRREKDDVVLWVDAVCIDQENMSERQAQVQIMRDIFSNATSVLAFLGDGWTHFTSNPRRGERQDEFQFYGDSRDKPYLDMFLKNPEHYRNAQLREAFGVFGIISIFAQHYPADYIKTLANLGDEVLHPLFEHFRMVLLSPWWSRIWTFQEIVVSRNTLVRHGDFIAPWKMFTDASKHIGQMRLIPDYQKVLDSFHDTVDKIERSRVRWNELILKQPYAGMDLYSLLLSTQKRKSSDDRDRVYALLGLTSGNPDMPPDYHVEVPDVYIRAARSITKSKGTLDVLYSNFGTKSTNDLPSWVPDWGSLVQNEGIAHKKRVYKLYNACKGLKFQCWSSIRHDWDLFFADIDHDAAPDTRNSIVNFFGQLRWLRSEYPSRPYGVEERKETWESILTPRHHHLQIPASYAGRIVAFSDQFLGNVDIRTLGALCSQWRSEISTNPLTWISEFGTPHLDMPTLRSLVFDLDGLHHRLDGDSEIDLLKWWYENQTSDKPQPERFPSRFTSNLNVMSYGRRLFMTETGNIGWGPEGLKRDDQIFVLPGGRTPFIIRGVDRLEGKSTGQLIGDCYLQGAMDGQLIDNDIPADKQTFIIKENIAFEYEDNLNRVYEEIKKTSLVIPGMPAGELERYASSWHEAGLRARDLAKQHGLKLACSISLE
ncbi:heterokaryon incompatibility protein-domain-containing protein [Annulohypoxylon moriforme]|nr:heterokaryon incompatibility protein-domain-containing protein [Annulohypoxylon moriforme]